MLNFIGRLRLYEVTPGSRLEETITVAIVEANTHNCTIYFKFNGVYLHVNSETNPKELKKYYLDNLSSPQENSLYTDISVVE